MPRPSPISERLLSAAKILLGVLGAAAALFVVFLAWLILGTFGVVWSPFNCLNNFVGKASGVAGHNFLVNQTACAGIGKGPTEVSVFISSQRPEGRSSSSSTFE